MRATPERPRSGIRSPRRFRTRSRRCGPGAGRSPSRPVPAAPPAGPARCGGEGAGSRSPAPLHGTRGAIRSLLSAALPRDRWLVPAGRWPPAPRAGRARTPSPRRSAPASSTRCPSDEADSSGLPPPGSRKHSSTWRESASRRAPSERRNPACSRAAASSAGCGRPPAASSIAFDQPAQVHAVGSDEELHRGVEGVQEPGEALDQRQLLFLGTKGEVHRRRPTDRGGALARRDRRGRRGSRRGPGTRAGPAKGRRPPTTAARGSPRVRAPAGAVSRSG